MPSPPSPRALPDHGRGRNKGAIESHDRVCDEDDEELIREPDSGGRKPENGPVSRIQRQKHGPIFLVGGMVVASELSTKLLFG